MSFDEEQIHRPSSSLHSHPDRHVCLSGNVAPVPAIPLEIKSANPSTATIDRFSFIAYTPYFELFF